MRAQRNISAHPRTRPPSWQVCDRHFLDTRPRCILPRQLLAHPGCATTHRPPGTGTDQPGPGAAWTHAARSPRCPATLRCLPATHRPAPCSAMGAGRQGRAGQGQCCHLRRHAATVVPRALAVTVPASQGRSHVLCPPFPHQVDSSGWKYSRRWWRRPRCPPRGWPGTGAPSTTGSCGSRCSPSCEGTAWLPGRSLLARARPGKHASTAGAAERVGPC